MIKDERRYRYPSYRRGRFCTSLFNAREESDVATRCWCVSRWDPTAADMVWEFKQRLFVSQRRVSMQASLTCLARRFAPNFKRTSIL